jgi:hypothetical protein
LDEILILVIDHIYAFHKAVDFVSCLLSEVQMLFILLLSQIIDLFRYNNLELVKLFLDLGRFWNRTKADILGVDGFLSIGHLFLQFGGKATLLKLYIT